MKKLMKFYLLSLSLATLPISTFAAQQSASLILKGTISEEVNIAVNAIPGNDSLDLISGVVDKHVATAVEYSNTLNGYEILVRSQNGGQLKHSESAALVDYDLSYDGIDLSNSIGTSDFQIIDASSAAGQVVTTSRDIKVTIQPQSGLAPGDYQDNITFTIKSL